MARSSQAPGHEPWGRGDATRPSGASLLTRRAALHAALACAGTCCLAACSGGDEGVTTEPAPTNPSEGKLGGKLVLYTSCTESLINAVVPAFMEDSGVAVRVVRGTTGELLGRLGEELAAGEPVADVLWGGDASWYVSDSGEKGGAAAGESGGSAAGLFQSYVSAENAAAREGCGNVAGIATPVTREVTVIAVGDSAGAGAASPVGDGAATDAGAATSDSGSDSHVVAESSSVAGSDLDAGSAADSSLDADSDSTGDASAAFVPASYVDLVDPRLGGPVALERPEDSAVALAHVAAIEAGLGAEDADAPWTFARELLAVAQEASGDELGDGEAALSSVLEGDAVAALSSEQACAALAAEGLGVSVVYPAEGAFVACGCTAVVRDCAHLAQARAWVDFVCGEGCQRVLSEQACSRPVREGVGDPAGLPEVGAPREVARESLLATWEGVRDGSWQPAPAAEPASVE